MRELVVRAVGDDDRVGRDLHTNAELVHQLALKLLDVGLRPLGGLRRRRRRPRGDHFFECADREILGEDLLEQLHHRRPLRDREQRPRVAHRDCST